MARPRTEASKRSFITKPRITLLERTALHNEVCRAQRIKLHPKSENLSEMVRDIVKKLEDSFDGLPERMRSTPGPGSLWKKQALDMTLAEIPRVPIAGTETGDFVGYGQYIYQPPEAINRRQTVKTNIFV